MTSRLETGSGLPIRGATNTIRGSWIDDSVRFVLALGV